MVFKKAYITIIATMIASTGTLSVQKVIMMFIATISKGTRMAMLRKKFHAMANPRAPSTHSPPNRMKGDGTGR